MSAFGAIRAVTPTAWNGDPNCWQMKRHAEKMKDVANGGALKFHDDVTVRTLGGVGLMGAVNVPSGGAVTVNGTEIE